MEDDLQTGHPAERGETRFKKLSVLMPLYNERWTVGTIIGRVLAVPLPLELEIVAVDDGSTDGSWEELQKLADRDRRIRAYRHDRNRGKGAAIRTAISHMSGDIAVMQDADLEYDPHDYLKLLPAIFDGRADAVFGSRFAGHPRRVLYFWHSLGNHLLTLLANLANDINLTDMETCYKMVRCDVLRGLRLRSNSFTLEPELTCRLAQWGARIYEVPISYAGRTYLEGKKIKAVDGLKVFWELFRCRCLDQRFTDHAGLYVLKAVARASRYHRWLLQQCRQYLGVRVLEAGAGIGNLSFLLLNSDRLVLVDNDPTYVARLRDQFGQRGNTRVVQADLTKPGDFSLWRDQHIDTVVCSNVLEHVGPDEQVLRSFYEALVPGGHCIVMAPAGMWLYNGMDRELGHQRRYSPGELRAKMQRAGFTVVYLRRISRLAALAWWVSGRIFRQRYLSPRQMIWFDRLFPLIRLLDGCLPLPGMSLIMVGRRPEDATPSSRGGPGASDDQPTLPGEGKP